MNIFSTVNKKCETQKKDSKNEPFLIKKLILT